MFDDNLLLYSNNNLTVAGGSALNITGTAVNLPQGFPVSGLALVALVQTAGGANRPLTIALQYSIDGGSNFLNACETIYANTKGVRVERWAANLLALVSDGFDTSKLQVRAKLDSPSHADAGDWDRVYVYLTPVGF